MPSVCVVQECSNPGLEIHQVDIKSVCLNIPLKETIYMKPPQGVLKPGQVGKVCHLLKGFYGLKQAGRGWHQEMSKAFINDLGFKCAAIDHQYFTGNLQRNTPLSLWQLMTWQSPLNVLRIWPSSNLSLCSTGLLH